MATVFRPFLTYPIFRLALSLAAGIFFADAVGLDGRALPYLWAGMLLGGILMAVAGGRKDGHGGLTVGAVALLFGATGAALYVLEQRRTAYEWEPGEAVYRAVVRETPRRTRKAWQSVVEVEAVRQPADGTWRPVKRRVLLYWLPDSLQGDLALGDRCCFRARLERPEGGRELGGFDYGRYLMRKGIAGTGTAFAGNWRKTGVDEEFSLSRELLRLRERWLSGWREGGLKGDELAVVAAVTVSERTGLSRELREAYTAAGASHILALSGLHVGLLVAVLAAVGYPLRRYRWTRTLGDVGLLGALWAFAGLTGLGVSVVRAVTMFTLYVVARRVTESRYRGAMALSAAAVVLLLHRPSSRFEGGFQLAFSAVAAILLCRPWLRRWTDGRSAAVRYVLQLAGMSVAAQAGTLPWVLYYFGVFPSYFLLTNLVVVPMVTVLLPLALGAAVVSAVPGVGALAMECLGAVAKGMNTVARTVHGWEGAQGAPVSLSGLQAVLVAALLLGIVAFCYRRQARAAVWVLSVAVALAGTGLYRRIHPEEVSVHLCQGAVWVKQGRKVERMPSTPTHIYKVGDCRVCLVNDRQWDRRRAGADRLRVDCLYVCRGFRGSLIQLAEVFDFRRVVVDDGVSDRLLARWRRECEPSGVMFLLLPEKGSWRIVPENEK